MGANSKQGWYLLLFLVGFTFLVAGLVYLGPIFSLIGLACLIASLVGFYRIKPLEHSATPEALSVVPPVATPKPERAVGSR
jgi:membrane-bound ClpP family serine protease